MTSCPSSALFRAALIAAFFFAPVGAGLHTQPRAQPIELGVTGIHHVPEGIWQGMSRAERLELLAQRADLAKAMGADVVRLGHFAPQIFGWDALNPEGSSFRSWDMADQTVEIFQSRGLRLVVTLPDLLDSGTGGFKTLVSAMAERWDGDTDFGIADSAKNYEFPDIDNSGQLTVSDWDASGADKQEWADAHRVEIVEIGDAPFWAEQTGALSQGAYATQLKAASDALRAVGGFEVKLASTVVDEQSENHFKARLEGLGADVFDIASGQVLETTGDPTMQTPSTSLAKLRSWVDGVGHESATLWVGGLSVGSAENLGPCDNPRCSERTQAAGIVKLVLGAIADGYSTMLYAFPLELIGAGADSGRYEGTGLVTLDYQEGFSPAVLPLQARPAFATWRRLDELLGGRTKGEIKPIPGLPDNARGFSVGEDGWLLWYDWSREVAPGEGYGGTKKLVTLTGLSSPSVKVVSLYSESVGQLSDDYTLSATFPEALVGVSAEGEADVFLEQDPVWIEASDEIVDTGPEPTPDAGGETPIDEGPDEPAASDEGGCAAGGPESGWALALLFGLGALSRRRRSALVP